MIDQLEKIGFEMVYLGEFCWAFDIDGYFFKSDGKTIEWDDGFFHSRLSIDSLERFAMLVEGLTGKPLDL